MIPGSSKEMALAIRSRCVTVFTIGLLSNKPLLGAVVLTVALHLLIIYVPFCNALFTTQPLAAAELGIAVASVVFRVVEAQNLIGRRRAVPALSSASVSAPAVPVFVG
nr:cation-translocating P-type ATPase C-terminal domain-containing protein [Hymenobacter terricola]